MYANKEGHGVYVIDCGEKNVHGLDYFEAKETIDDFHLSLGAKVSLDEGIELLLNRVKKFDLQNYLLLKKWWEQFWMDTKFISETRIIDSRDLGAVLDFSEVAPGCELKQAVVQLKKTLPMEFRYYITKSIWDRLSDIDKIGLVFHELLYRKALQDGHKTSNQVRYLNSILSSSYFAFFDWEVYLHLRRQSNLSGSINYNNFVFEDKFINNSWSAKNYPGSRITQGILYKPASVELKFYPNKVTIGKCLLNNFVELDLQGRVKKACLTPKQANNLANSEIKFEKVFQYDIQKGFY